MPSARRLLPCLAWTPELRDPRVLRADLVAGLTVALILIPQSMAYAQLAGLPPFYGLYAAFLPPAIAALWGSSRQLATGPVAMVSLMVGAALAPFAASGADVVPIAILMALLAGVFQLVLGLMRLGLLVDFLSHPVLVGVTNAAALVIATSQLDKLLGVRAAKAPHHYETVWNVVVAAAQGVHWPALGLAALAFALMLTAKRIDRRIPGVLLAVVATTILAWAIGYHAEERVPQTSLAGTAGHLVGQLRHHRDLAASLAPRIAAADRRCEEAVARFGPKHAQVVEATLAADELRVARDDAEREAKVHLDALRRLRYRRDRADHTFYGLGETPGTLPEAGREWRLRSVDAGGTALIVTGGNVVGEVPQGLPALRLPSFNLADLLAVLPAALLLSLLGFVEAISIAKSMALSTRQRVDANQELIGQGLANIGGALTQSYPVSGSFSRSAVNLAAGARTGFAGVVTSLVVIAVLLFCTPLLYHLPEATLAAVIMMAVANLVKIQPILHAWKVSRRDALVAVATFLITLIAAPHLEIGILTGVGLSLAAYLATTMRPQVAVLARHPDGSLRDADRHGLARCRNVLVLRFDGRLYFANASHFEDRLIAEVAACPTLRAVVIAGSGINSLDATGEEVLAHLVERLEAQGIRVVFWGLRHRIYTVLEHTGVVARLGAERFVGAEPAALALAEQLAGCEAQRCATCPLQLPSTAGEPAPATTDSPGTHTPG